jgi:hypothetical protein
MKKTIMTGQLWQENNVRKDVQGSCDRPVVTGRPWQVIRGSQVVMGQSCWKSYDRAAMIWIPWRNSRDDYLVSLGTGCKKQLTTCRCKQRATGEKKKRKKEQRCRENLGKNEGTCGFHPFRNHIVCIRTVHPWLVYWNYNLGSYTTDIY